MKLSLLLASVLFSATAAAQPIGIGFVKGVPVCGSGLAVGANVSANGIVRAYATDGTRHFIGGDFTSVNGQTRQRFAAFDASWNLLPALDFNNSIHAMQMVGGSLYIGGDFTSYGDFKTTFGAPVDAVNGTLPASFAGVNSNVYVAVSDGSDGWYIGGLFNSVGGVTRNYAARILSDGSLDPNWNPNLNGAVNDILVDSDRVYLAGNFTTASGGTAAVRLVSVNKSTGAIVANNFNVNSNVNSVGKLGSDLVIGGDFSSVGAFKSTGLGRVDKTNGAYESSFPSGSSVYKVISDGNGGYYVAGAATYAGRNYLTHILSDGTGDSSFNASVNSSVNDLALDTSTTPPTLFVAGNFTSIGGASRRGAAALNANTGVDLGVSYSLSGFPTGVSANSTNVFFSGPFARAGAITRSGGALLSPADGTTQIPAVFNDAVMSSVADGNGGWYVGGNFTSITDANGTFARRYVAHLNSDGTVDTAFNPASISGQVTLVYPHADGLYIGGAFATIGGVSRRYFARLNAVTGALDTNFADPNLNQYVYCAVAESSAAGSDIFIGGDFFTAGPSALPRGRLARFTSTGILQAWNPTANSSVYGLARGPGANIFASGSFSSMGGVSSPAFAALNAADGTRNSSFNPTIAGNSVYGMLFDSSDNTLVLIGNFSLSSSTRYGVAAYDVGASNLTLKPFAPNPTNGNHYWPSGYPMGLAKSGNSVFLSFGSYALGANQRTFAYDLTATNTKLWESQASETDVRTLSLSGSKLLVGYAAAAGLNGTQRLRVASFNKLSGALDPNFQADLSGLEIYSVKTVADRGILATDSRVYLGGYFNTLNGAARNYFAAVSASTGSLDTSFPVRADNYVSCMERQGSSIFLGGQFNSVTVNSTSSTRRYLAGFNESDGSLLAHPNLSSLGGSVNLCALKADGGSLYFGAQFTALNGTARGAVAAVNLADSTISTWDPNAGTGTVYSIAVDATKVVIGGNYSSIGGRFRNYLAGISVSTGDALPASPALNSTVYKVLPDGTNLFIGGSFSSVNSLSRQFLAKLDTATANWDPVPLASFGARGNGGNWVRTLLLDGGLLYVGAYNVTNFYDTSGSTFTRRGFAVFDSTNGNISSLDLNIQPSSGSVASVSAITKSGNTLYVGGSGFSSIKGSIAAFAGAYDLTSNSLTSWAPNANGTVNTLAMGNGKIYIGGSFSNLGGLSRVRAAKLDLSNASAVSVVSGWSPSFDSTVRALAGSSDGSQIFAGGSFTIVGSTSTSYLTGLNASNGGSSAWSTSVNSPVYSLLQANGTVFAGGQFTIAKGAARNYAAAFSEASTGDLHIWNPNANSTVLALAYNPDESLVYLGGSFTSLSGSARGGIGAVSLTNTLSPYAPDTNGSVNAITYFGNKIYIGGTFSTLNGASRSRLGVTDRNGLVQTWNPAPNTTVTGIASYGTGIVTVGDFTSIHGNGSRVRVNQSDACNLPY